MAQAARGEWEAAVETNRQLVELGGDVDAYNRLGKALSELDRNEEALEAYQAAHRAGQDEPDRRAEHRAPRSAAHLG